MLYRRTQHGPLIYRNLPFAISNQMLYASHNISPFV